MCRRAGHAHSLDGNVDLFVVEGDQPSDWKQLAGPVTSCPYKGTTSELIQGCALRVPCIPDYGESGAKGIT